MQPAVVGPGFRLVEVDLSRHGPPKSSQVGFICRSGRFLQAQLVLGRRLLKDWSLKF